MRNVIRVIDNAILSIQLDTECFSCNALLRNNSALGLKVCCAYKKFFNIGQPNKLIGVTSNIPFFQERLSAKEVKAARLLMLELFKEACSQGDVNVEI